MDLAKHGKWSGRHDLTCCYIEAAQIIHHRNIRTWYVLSNSLSR